MTQEFRWNMIPAAEGPLPEDFYSDAYTLNHWKLIDLGEGVSLEGHIHGRTEFPDGLQISTSFLIRYYRTEQGFYFETANSGYFCRMQEYILDSHSLPLLEGLADDELSGDIETARKKRCRNLLEQEGLGGAVFLNWCGCDSPYLKWTAYADDSHVEIDDNGAVSFETSAAFMLSENGELSVFCTSSPRSRIHLTSLASEACPVFIENSGTKPLKAMTGPGRRPLHIEPGSRMAVKITFEPVYSVIH